MKGFNPVFENKFFDSYFLQGYEPIGLLHVNYIIPKGRKVSFKGFVGAASPQQQDLGKATSYSWEIAGTDKVDYEPNTPYWHSARQWIQCSEFQSWSEVAKWAAAVNPIPHITSGGKLAEFADKLWEKEGENSSRYVQAVTDFVQNNVRYMGVEVGEYSHRANAPEKVFAQRYGDCKDKSVLIATLLKYKGIESRLVLANTYEQYGLETYLPSPAAFNHMVIEVLLDGRSKFIDPTISNQGGTFFDRYFPFYGKVLPISLDARLRDTEKIVSGNIRVEEKLQLEKDGNALFDVRTVYRGSDADQIRSYFRQTAKNQVEKSYAEYYQRFYKQLSKHSPLTYEDDLINDVFIVEEHYTIKNLSETDPSTNRRYVGVYASNVNNYLPEIMDGRTSPIALAYPLSIEHDIYVINPEGVEVPFFKENTFVDRESYYFGKSVSSVNDTLKIAYRLGFHETHVKADKVQEYYADFANKNDLFSAVVYLDSDGFLTGSTTGKSFNVWAILVFLGTMVLLIWLVRRFYHERRPSSIIPLYDEMQHDQIGGWLILLLIGLSISSIKVFFTGMVQTFFSEITWSALQYNHGVPSAVFAGLIIFEFMSNCVLLFLLVYCAVLLVKRRDIFPQTLFFTLLYQVVIILLDLGLSTSLLGHQIEDVHVYTDFIRAFIFSTIWSLYIYNSTRVKGTFLLLSKSEQAKLADEDAILPPIPHFPTLPVFPESQNPTEEIEGAAREDQPGN